MHIGRTSNFNVPLECHFLVIHLVGNGPDGCKRVLLTVTVGKDTIAHFAIALGNLKGLRRIASRDFNAATGLCLELGGNFRLVIVIQTHSKRINQNIRFPCQQDFRMFNLVLVCPLDSQGSIIGPVVSTYLIIDGRRNTDRVATS